MLEQEFGGIWMPHLIDSCWLLEKWESTPIRITLLSGLGAAWDCLQLKKRGTSLQTACPVSISDAFQHDSVSVTPMISFPECKLGTARDAS